MYELRSYKKPLLQGHTPIPLDGSDGDPKLLNAKDAALEATRLFSNPDCWHITINDVAVDGEKTLRGTSHWCANAKQAQDYIKERETN